LNILVLNHYAGSPRHGMEYRPYYLAREWVRAGHRVTIVAASFSHVRREQPAVRGVSADESIDGITYRWLRTPRYVGNGVGRARNLAAFLWRAWREAPRLAALRPDVVIASSTYPMDIWVARRIARLSPGSHPDGPGARLVHEVHDLWPLSPIELGGMSRLHPFILICAAAEKAACRDADVVVSMLPCVHAHLSAMGLDLGKLHVVPNGVAPEEWEILDPHLEATVQRVVAASRAAGHRIVGYAGSHGLPNALDTLLDAAVLLRNAGVEFVLVGDGQEKARLQRRVTDEDLSHVKLLDPIPKAQIPAFLAAVDIAYIGWQRVPIYRFGVAPNKLMDYMMAARPVLHAIEAGNDPVAEAGCGMTVEPGNPAAVVAGLRHLLALDPGRLREMGLRGRDYVLAHHTYPVLARRFLDAIASDVGLRRA